MALRKPLVHIDGRDANLPSDDCLHILSDNDAELLLESITDGRTSILLKNTSGQWELRNDSVGGFIFRNETQSKNIIIINGGADKVSLTINANRVEINQNNVDLDFVVSGIDGDAYFYDAGDRQHRFLGGRSLQDGTTAISSTLTKADEFMEQTAIGITTSLDATPTQGQTHTIDNASGGNNTVDGNGKNIQGSATVSIFAGEVFRLRYNGTEWRLF